MKTVKIPAKKQCRSKSATMPSANNEMFNFESDGSPSKPTYTTGRGNNVLNYQGQRYIKNNAHSGKIYWKCTKWHSGCKGRAITNVLIPGLVVLKNTHNHEPS
ncbi:hypothetical protein RP20_CCG025811 [Aedes albopictus]|nr:hypothetical protein RP20_CCG025811 [Aedes albopictus]